MLDIEMRRAHQSLAGTWTGILTVESGVRFPLPEVTLTHSGAAVATTPILSFGVFIGGFTGTLRDTARIGSTTDITGTLTWNTTRGNPRAPINCRGTGDFTGTVNWTDLPITAPRVVYDCAGEPPTSATYSLVRQQ